MPQITPLLPGGHGGHSGTGVPCALLPLLADREEKRNQLEALYDEWAEISE